MVTDARLGKRNGAAIKTPGAQGLETKEADAPAAKMESSGVGSVLQPSAEMLARVIELRNKLQLSVGQIVLALMNVPRYRHQTLADLLHLVLDPLMRDRLSIAHRRSEGKAQGGDDEVAGIAIWANVSAAVDAKIAEQVKAGVFPVRLAPEDWMSGEILWLLDVIAPDRKAATAVLANFRQISGDRDVKIHPVVAREVDPDVLEKMRIRAAEQVLAADGRFNSSAAGGA